MTFAASKIISSCLLMLGLQMASSAAFMGPLLSKSTSKSMYINKQGTSTALQMGYGRSNSALSNRNNDRSKRQERVGHVVRTEVATIIQQGHQIKNQQSYIDDELRRRINVVNADVSPDLRQARITVSVIKPRKKVEEEDEYYDEEEEEDDDEEEEDDLDEGFDIDFDDEEDDEIEMKQAFPVNNSGDSVVDRRRAYAWLVRNTSQIKHALSQRLKHMKSIPSLTFVQADVGAAVDVMSLIDKVSKGNYKRSNLGMFGGDDDVLPANMYLESELEDDYEWFDEDDEDDDEVGFDEDEEEEEELAATKASKDEK